MLQWMQQLMRCINFTWFFRFHCIAFFLSCAFVRHIPSKPLLHSVYQIKWPILIYFFLFIIHSFYFLTFLCIQRWNFSFEFLSTFLVRWVWIWYKICYHQFSLLVIFILKNLFSRFHSFSGVKLLRHCLLCIYQVSCSVALLLRCLSRAPFTKWNV